MHIFHKWSKWSDPITTYDGGRKQQWRVCTNCNKVKFYILPWDKQSIITDILKAVAQVKAPEDK